MEDSRTEQVPTATSPPALARPDPESSEESSAETDEFQFAGVAGIPAPHRPLGRVKIGKSISELPRGTLGDFQTEVPEFEGDDA